MSDKIELRVVQKPDTSVNGFPCHLLNLFYEDGAKWADMFAFPDVSIFWMRGNPWDIKIEIRHADVEPNDFQHVVSAAYRQWEKEKGT